MVGRIWWPEAAGPALVTWRGDQLVDITAHGPTMSALLDRPDVAAIVREAPGEAVGPVADIVAASLEQPRNDAATYLLAPVDLQAVKAAGVTFASSLIERVIEEQAKGDPARADEVRRDITARIGTDLSAIVPGSDAAMQRKEAFIERGVWSQYLEVGIGPDAEVFTKCQPMAAVGPGAEIGLHPASTWNNPEPEIVLVATSRGEAIGATLGNDVNLRDVEGRSALLLGRAKDNNASTALGPFIRLFDETYTLDDVRTAEVDLTVNGRDDGYRLTATSSMSEISRDVADLLAQTVNRNHQYPDGLVLFCGTMFAPVDDRDTPGEGFTHHIGDVVEISTPTLGKLLNTVTTSEQAPPWTFGAGALMVNLARRGYLPAA